MVAKVIAAMLVTIVLPLVCWATSIVRPTRVCKPDTVVWLDVWESHVVAVYGDGHVALWDLGTGQSTARWDTKPIELDRVQIARGGNALALARWDNAGTTVTFHDIEHGRVVSTTRLPGLTGLLQMGFSKDGARFAMGAVGGTIVCIDVRNGRIAWQGEDPADDPMRGRQLLADGTIYASIIPDAVEARTANGRLVWRKEAKARDLVMGADQWSSLVIVWEGASESCFALSPTDGGEVWRDDAKGTDLCAVSGDGMVRLYQTQDAISITSKTGVVSLQRDPREPIDAMFAPDVSLVVVLSKLQEKEKGEKNVTVDRSSSELGVFDVRTGRLVRTLDLSRPAAGGK